MATIRENYQNCGRGFAKGGWPRAHLVQLLAGVSNERAAEIALDAFDRARDEAPLDVELVEMVG